MCEFTKKPLLTVPKSIHVTLDKKLSQTCVSGGTLNKGTCKTLLVEIKHFKKTTQHLSLSLAELKGDIKQRGKRTVKGDQLSFVL